MGLTRKSTGKNLVHKFDKEIGNSALIALAGSPNVGKSTVFNALTGMKQHTGNWTGKTVETAVGQFKSRNNTYLLADVPGMYSLCARSEEEKVSRNFICCGGSDAVIVVCDALCLERNLSLVLQIAERTNKVCVCVNLLDQANKRGVKYDLYKLSEMLGVEVAGCSAKKKQGLDKLVEKTEYVLNAKTNGCFKVKYPARIEAAIAILELPLEKLLDGKLPARFTAIKLLCGENEFAEELQKYAQVDFSQDKDFNLALKEAKNFLLDCGLSCFDVSDMVSQTLTKEAERICKECIVNKGNSYSKADVAADRIITGKFTAFPIMLLMLGVIFFITVIGANYPSKLLSDLFFSAENWLYEVILSWGMPEKICEMLVFGMYRVTVWVVSVMLPPMAIFFPLFTLMEDAGFLPRIAYNLDRCFNACKACGKQALTMCMGFGCNAAGVVGCRIIDSPREKMIAILTNSFVPCNGRFPMLISIIGMFLVLGDGNVTRSLFSSFVLVLLILCSCGVSLIASFILSKTILKGKPSSFTLELPPYRCPKIASVLVRSFLDRTLFVLGRAVLAAAPAGVIIWLFANISIGDSTLLGACTGFLDPFARIFGLDGVILVAFILGLPANEIVVPIIIMAYMADGSLSSLDANQLKMLFVNNGWTTTTALCTCVFSLMHWPCATTLMTIRKEAGNTRMMLFSAVLPTLFGLFFCYVINSVSNIFV